MLETKLVIIPIGFAPAVAASPLCEVAEAETCETDVRKISGTWMCEPCASWMFPRKFARN